VRLHSSQFSPCHMPPHQQLPRLQGLIRSGLTPHSIHPEPPAAAVQEPTTTIMRPLLSIVAGALACATVASSRAVVPAAGCEALLTKTCGKNQKESRVKCEACVEKLDPSKECTLKQEFAFCDAAPGPPPSRDSCLQVLKKDCESRRANVKECEGCVARVEHAKLADCTRQDELKFCHGDTPPAPISDPCLALLDDDCKHHYGKYDGNACCECRTCFILRADMLAVDTSHSHGAAHAVIPSHDR
jgi:hypothetical protein